MSTLGHSVICSDPWPVVEVDAVAAGNALLQVVLLSVVTASLAFTVTETVLFAPLREWIKRRSLWLGKLFSCGYCLGWWIALMLVVLYQPRLLDRWWLLDYFLTAAVIAWLAAFQWIALCWLMDRAGK